MKKLSLLLGAITLVLILGLQSCGGGGATGNSPGATVKKAFNLLADKKFDKAAEMYTKKDGTAFTEEEKGKMLGLMSMASAKLTEKKGLKSLEIVEEKIAEDGKTANVKWKITYGNDETDTDNGNLMKVDGDWKMIIGN
jgi:hypothetical protein